MKSASLDSPFAIEVYSAPGLSALQNQRARFSRLSSHPFRVSRMR